MALNLRIEGKLRDEAAFHQFSHYSRRFAAQYNWAAEPISTPHAVLRRSLGDHPASYEGPTRGVCLYPYGAGEPLRFEFDRDLYVQQCAGISEGVFCHNGSETPSAARVDAHVRVVELLRQVAPLFEFLKVTDESRFWETGDREQLRAILETVAKGETGVEGEIQQQHDSPQAGESGSAPIIESDSFSELKKRAEEGDASGQFGLAMCYRQGIDVKANERTAARWFRCAAQQGHLQAVRSVGLCYLAGCGVPQNIVEGVTWLRQAALQGDAEAQQHLAQCYLDGVGVAQDSLKAFQWVRRSAAQNHGEALNLLGEFYMETNPGKAFSQFSLAAAQQHPAGLFNLGQCLYHGHGVEEDKPRAFGCFQEAAALDCDAAVDMLGDCYKFGHGIAVDESQALRHYRTAADRGNARAQVSLGACYEFGEGVRMDLQHAAACYTEAAQQEDPHGKYCLAVSYETAIGVGVDRSRALQLYLEAAEKGHISAQGRWAYLQLHRGRQASEEDQQKALEFLTSAAGAGDAAALTYLGCCYEHGLLTAAEPVHAVECYQAAAESGEPRAQFLLGLCLMRGRGVQQDCQKAKSWYERAAAEGHAHPRLALGFCFERGLGAPQDVEQALDWYRQTGDAFTWPDEGPVLLSDPCWAPPEESAPNLPDTNNPQQRIPFWWLERAARAGHGWAMHNLAGCYEVGHGVWENFSLAADWYEKAAGQGLSVSFYQLGLCRELGVGRDADPAEAARCYQKAAENNWPPAIDRLGECYYYGRGVERNPQEARRLFQLAAELGCPSAMANLAHCYDSGVGADRNSREALFWYHRAMGQQYEPAAAAIRRLEAEMAPS